MAWFVTEIVIVQLFGYRYVINHFLTAGVPYKCQVFLIYKLYSFKVE